MKYKDEKIVMIEYFNDIPYSVLTEWNTYDFDMHANGWLMFYHAGCWQVERIIHDDSKLAVPGKHSIKIWVDPEYEIRLKHQEGYELVKNPVMIKFPGIPSERHNNPFVVGEEVFAIIYCEKCEKYYDEVGCYEHLEEE